MGGGTTINGGATMIPTEAPTKRPPQAHEPGPHPQPNPLHPQVWRQSGGLPVVMEHASLIEFVRILVVLRLVGDAVALEFQEFRLKCTRDNAGDFVLQFEQVGEVAIESLGHYVMGGVGADQLY